MEDTITSYSKLIKSQLSEDKRKITWNYQEGDLENNVQKMSFIMKLDMSKVSEKYLQGTSQIWTNGTTIDVNKDSEKSAWLSYGTNGIIELSSPKLTVDFDIKPTSEPTAEPTKDPTPTATPEPDPIIEFTSGEDVSASGHIDRVFYMYFINNEYIRSEDIKFKIKKSEESIGEGAAELYFGTPQINGSKVTKIDNRMISLFDSTGKEVVCDNETNCFKIEIGKEYTVKLNKGDVINQVLEKKTDYSMNVVVSNTTVTRNIRVIKRECFEVR